jgi:hypothetical protein
MRHKLLYAALFSVAAACAPKLGDPCENATECSANGDRICDTSQPGGYCTIANCESGSCGDEGVCVRFKADAPRLSSNWCMLKCDKTRDCDRDDYVCRSAAQISEARASRPEEGDSMAVPGSFPFAEVLDGKKSAKFCVVKE